MFVGFFAWYSGLARAGIARASQLQLTQPFLTIGIAALILGERPGPITYVAAAVVLVCVLAAQRARFGHSSVRQASPNVIEPTTGQGLDGRKPLRWPPLA
jgi:drug/metabolite transporter (DMT)-like permease